MRREWFAAFVCAALLTLGAPVSASAQQNYPNRPIVILVGSAPGSGTDAYARILADRLTDRLGQRVIVENKPGAGANIAQADIARATPDGYRLVMTAPASPINHTLYTTPGFDMLKDFKAIAAFAESPLMFVVNPKVPVSSLKELAAYAKSNPGKLNYGSGVGFMNHMLLELFKFETGADIQFIPYQGMAPARTDTVSGQIEVLIESTSTSAPFVESGQLKALAVTSKVRMEQFPNLPTAAEAGFPSLTRTAWYGLMGPAALPDDITNRLAAEIAKIQAEPETISKLRAGGAQPLVMASDEFGKFIAGETNTWADLIARAKITKIQ